MKIINKNLAQRGVRAARTHVQERGSAVLVQCVRLVQAGQRVYRRQTD